MTFESPHIAEFRHAIEAGDAALVSALVKRDPALARTPIRRHRGDGSFFEIMPLFAANQSLKMSALLVEHGADVNAHNPAAGGLALHDAAPAVSEFLLKQGADPNAVGYEGYTALMYAAYMGEVENTALLLRYGARVEPRHPIDGFNALHCACFYSRLLQGFKTEDGFTPDRHRDVVQMLLQAGCDVHARCASGVGTNCGPLTVDGETALHFAAAGGDLEILHALRKAGAKRDAENGAGERSEDWAARYNRSESVIRLLAAE